MEARHTPLHRARISCGLYRADHALVFLLCVGSREFTLRVPR